MTDSASKCLVRLLNSMDHQLELQDVWALGVFFLQCIDLYPDSAEIRKTPLPIALEAILLHP